jgi:REP-associated tyrosine transposase
MPLAPQELRTYFITIVTANRRRLFQVEQNANLFIDVLHDQRTKGRLQLHAFVVMPDHAHLLLTPAPNISLEKTMQYIKGGFSFRLQSKLDVWERSYDSRRITDPHDYSTHINYIHQNPVRANLASNPDLYPHSTANPINPSDPTPNHLH